MFFGSKGICIVVSLSFLGAGFGGSVTVGCIGFLAGLLLLAANWFATKIEEIYQQAEEIQEKDKPPPK